MRGWVKRVKHHECRTPSSMRTGVGSLWRCRCGALWECVENTLDPRCVRLVRWSRREEPTDGR